jgi:rSAM/selenodomain-associated transferase 2
LADPVTISIVIPVYRDSEALAHLLGACDLTADARVVDVIVAGTAADGDALAPLRARWPLIRWVVSPKGRARQMNAGAAFARGAWLLFLHADTLLPPQWCEAISTANCDPRIALGCFRFALDSASVCARLIEWGVRFRVAVCALPYGDQALFMRRELFERLGGYADVPIMEDVDLVRRVLRHGRLFTASVPAVTSARKWEEDGWGRRTLKHLRLITLYFLGVTPERLATSI